MKIMILAGGSGTRLFPLSREKYPKQFLKLFNGESLLQKTLLRALKITNSLSDIILIVNQEYKFYVLEQVKAILNKAPEHLILEPCRRNTLPAITLGVFYLLENKIVDMEEPLLILSSDHIIFPENKFIEYIQKAEVIAKKGYIVTFGILPTKPETGYGYIELNRDKKINEAFLVKKFHEKPSLEEAIKYLQNNNFLWNSGIFCFTPKTFLTELELRSPDIFTLIKDKSFQEIRSQFSKMPDLSIDYGIMEKTNLAVVLPLEINWSDVGSFEALYEVYKKDEHLNAIKGKVYAVNSKRNLIISNKRFIITLGVEDLIIAETEDIILVAKKGEGQRIKEIVNLLKSDKHTRSLTEFHLTEYRPWGSFTLLEEGTRYKIKKITVAPGESLSFQMHYHRSEHWVVIKGTALVVIENENGELIEKFVRENESIFIPKTVKHRLINPGKIPLELIEVQVGEYVGEDDIVRIEDKYERLN